MIIKFWNKYCKYDSDFYFNEVSDFSNKNTSNSEECCSTIIQPFPFEPEQKKTSDDENHENADAIADIEKIKQEK